jgi:hypothetical protein
MKHVNDTQWVNTPTRERLAATRKRTLRRVTVRGARSVWSECQSRVIESRNSVDRLGLPVCERGGSIALHTIRRHRRVAQAMCRGTGPGAESGAKAQWGILGSWESRPVPIINYRIWTTPVYQSPGAALEFSASPASEASEKGWASASEGNRSARTGGGGRRSGLIVAIESRVTHRREPVSSEGDCRGEERAIERNGWELQPMQNVSPCLWHLASESEFSP